MQVYATPHGPAILVGLEDRDKGPEYHFVLAYDGVVRHTWHKTLPEDFELVHDPGSRAETEVLKVETNALIREKEVLLDCMQAALGMLDERSAEQVRDIYRARMKTADYISITKGA